MYLLSVVVGVLLVLTVTTSKITKLRELTEKNALWALSDDQFKEYVVNGPRDYSVVLFFTSDWCTACPMIQEQLVKLAQWYLDTETEREIFFAEVEWERNKNIINIYKDKIVAMPSVILITPTTKKTTVLKFDEKNRAVLQKDISPEYFSQFINTRLGEKKIGPPELSKWIKYGIPAALVLLTLFVIWRFYKATSFWSCVALLFPWFTYTGTYFNLNAGSPFIYYGQNNNEPVIFWPSQQMQTGAEGLILATLIVLIGIIFSLFITCIPNIRYSRRSFVFYPLFLIIGGLLGVYYKIWTIKNSWYLVYA